MCGLLMPLLVLASGLGIKYGVLYSSSYVSDTALWLLCSAFIALGVWQYVMSEALSIRMQLINTVAYHVLAALFLLYIAGFDNAVVLMWVILLIASDMYFGKRAYILSFLALCGTGAAYVAMRPGIMQYQIIELVLIILVIGITGYLVARLRMVNDQERKALQHMHEQEELHRDRLMTLINSMGDAVMSTDEKGVVRLYNAALLNLLDTNESLTGKNISSLFDLKDSAGKKVKGQDLLLSAKSATVRTDLTHSYKDGEPIHLSVSMAPIRPSFHQQSQFGYILVIRDITKDKSLEEERDEFISVVSHELRTPIAIAEGQISNVQLLMKRGAKAGDLDAAMASAHEQVMYLAKLVNDLSALSRAERGVADAQEDIDVDALLHGMYEEYRSQAAEKGLALNLDVKGKIGTVHVSRLYLEEILQNFVTNAIKYTKEGSVTMAATLSEGEVLFSVKDTGIGISKTDQTKIFEKFYRSEDYRTRETNGTGLGLYVVHKLASKLQTTIKVKSRLNHGSEFSFVIPSANK